MNHRLLCLLVVSGAVSLAQADVRLPAIFSDNMVLQQDTRIPVWGWADDDEEVTVEFHDQRLKTKARNGRWQVRFRPVNAGGPDEMIVSGKNRLVIKNVLVGEVWVASGQSNMEWPLQRSHEPQADIRSATNAQIRLFTVPKLKAEKPVTDVKGSWQICSPQTVSNFSAVAYYFGRALQQQIRIPVGLIHTSWGGSPAEVWMDEPTLAGDLEYQRDIVERSAEPWRRYQEQLAAWEKEPGTTRNRPNPPWRPSELYHGMIAPLIPYAIRGALWYQGESNAGRAHQYRRLFVDLIRNWRQRWGQGDFPFLFVQLAPWDQNKKRSLADIAATPGDSTWAELREAQWLAARTLPKVGMAVITDVGDKDDIHPGKKEPVGERLALAARAIAYGEKIAYSGPLYKQMKVRGNEIVLTFDHAQGGLEAREGDLKGFTIAGDDRKFVNAEARIEGNQVVVSHPQVARPIAVRYGWADYPVVNLFNKAGLPATPFRTDDFPLTTRPKS